MVDYISQYLKSRETSLISDLTEWCYAIKGRVEFIRQCDKTRNGTSQRATKKLYRQAYKYKQVGLWSSGTEWNFDVVS